MVRKAGNRPKVTQLLSGEKGIPAGLETRDFKAPFKTLSCTAGRSRRKLCFKGSCCLAGEQGLTPACPKTQV